MQNEITSVPNVPAVAQVPARERQWLSVSSVRDGAAFAAMRTEWTELLEQSDAGTFNHWEWVYPWFRRIGPDRELRILTARDRAGKLIGLMPLCVEQRRVAGRRVRRLSFLAEDHVGSDYLDVVARRGHEEDVARAFAVYLRDTVTGWDVIDLVDFENGSTTVKVFSEVFGADFQVRVSDRYLCPCEHFKPGENFDQFLRRTARRDNYLRRKKWLEKQEGYRIEKTTVPADLARPMTEFFRLHSARWMGDGGSQGIKGPSVEAFHRDATHLFAEQGKLRLYTMWVGGKAVASVYGIIDRGVFSYFQSGYDPEWRNKSVGLVLVGETFRD
ncbi:MAG: GNAT family N-acetyltransferase, partial [Myxococcaceae bacterium]